MKFNKIVKIFFMAVLCGAVAPAYGMWKSIQNYMRFSVAVESEPEWWVELETSIANDDLEETENLLNQMTNEPGFLESKLNFFSRHGRHDSYSHLASTILDSSIRYCERWRVDGSWCNSRPLSLKQVKRIISLLFTYKRIDLNSGFYGMKIICNVAESVAKEESLDMDYVKYLYAQGIQNIAPYTFLAYGPLRINRRLMLFEFFMERWPWDLRIEFFKVLKGENLVKLFGEAQSEKNTKFLRLLFAYAVRNDHVGNYVAHIMNDNEAKKRGHLTYKQEMFDVIKEAIRHEYCNEHFQNDFQKTLVAALKMQQYSDVDFNFSK